MLVIQVMVRLREAFQLDLPFRSLFTTSTVAGLGEAMLGVSGQIERTAELMVELSRLSDAEVEAMLARDTTTPLGGP